jgi:hypothetical protein
MLTCRRKDIQGKVREALAVVAKSDALSLVKFVKKQNPSSLNVFKRTIRALGPPLGVVVERTIAFGSKYPASVTSSYQI